MTVEELRALPVYFYGAVVPLHQTGATVTGPFTDPTSPRIELFKIDGRGMVGQEIAGELHERHGLHASTAGRYSSQVVVACWKAES